MNNKNKKILVAILGVLVFILVFHLLKRRQHSEKFGQDASIRASVGGIAGPSGLYGIDPIQQFANQLESLREREGFSHEEECSLCG